MGLENAKDGKLLYHLTKLSNLQSIIEHGLVSRKALRENMLGFEDIADPEIIKKRDQLGLSGYVPFHFHPYSAFDFAVKYANMGEEMMYICVSREWAQENNFKIIPKHPLSIEDCNLYDYDEGFEKIDWDTLMEVGRTDNEARLIKMAECLSENPIPVRRVLSINVSSEVVRTKVQNILAGNGISAPPYVNVQPEWFILEE